MKPLELWGGIECTVNRVGNIWFNQLQRSGHAERLEDLNRIADLGIRTLRYPLLWELAEPRPNVPIDWRWADERLARLRALNVRPIVGLCHHGSGPAHTNLVDPGFASGLACYARRVAERFPWIDCYTPVNEPLTTARFSGLYGLWYPHGRDDHTFVRALVNQCRGIALAMQAIRTVNPAARLLQTDDIGRTYSTPKMAYQAEFDNERRWLAWDLLCGKVDTAHALHGFLLASGASAEDLAWLRDHACPPEVIGINHYVTSDRFLDERWSGYPSQFWGRNGREPYADLDAVRILQPPADSWRRVLQETWNRYRIPLAITEVHLGCTREEQLRWLRDAWSAAQDARDEGLEVLAVTTWALFGSFNWNTLLTTEGTHYESGAFDVRAPEPRLTAVAKQVRALTSGESSWHAALDGEGWWRRPRRLLNGHAAAAIPDPDAMNPSFVHLRPHPPARAILICGGAGVLGRAFAHACEERGLAYVAHARAQLDICNPTSIEAALNRVSPWAVINAAGYTRVEDAEHEPVRCHFENATGARVLAAAAHLRGLPLLTFSSDLVFDGHSDSPYLESSPVAPIGVYAMSKAAAETAVLSEHPRALCIRTAALFSSPSTDYLADALYTLASGKRFQAFEDVIVSPTFVPDLVHAALDLLIDDHSGLWHLANRGSVSWMRFIQLAADAAHIDSSRLEACSCATRTAATKRPRFTVLGSERGVLLPTLEDALGRYASSLREQGLTELPREMRSRARV